MHDYTGPGRDSAYLNTVYRRLHRLSRHGYPINLNIGVGNGGGGAPFSRADFLHFVRQVVARHGRWLQSVEITNEPNVPSPSTSDGATPGIVQDLVQGVIAAKRAADARHLPLKVGFNIAYGYGTDPVFWTQLEAAATPTFLRDVDFLGLHTYPNPGSIDTPVNSTIDTIELRALATARCLMTNLGLAHRIPIDITEVGYPTTRGRAELRPSGVLPAGPERCGPERRNLQRPRFLRVLASGRTANRRRLGWLRSVHVDGYGEAVRENGPPVIPEIHHNQPIRKASMTSGLSAASAQVREAVAPSRCLNHRRVSSPTSTMAGDRPFAAVSPSAIDIRGAVREDH